MTTKSDMLELARNQLRRAEQLGLVEESAYLLDEAAYALDKAIRIPQERKVAQNLGTVYGTRFRRWINESLEDRSASEQRLELLLLIANALKDNPVYRCGGISESRIAIVRRLLDKYFEGWTDEERERELARIFDARRATNGILSRLRK